MFQLPKTDNAASGGGACVSRPFFVKLLENNELPYHLAGTHRRVYLQDLLVYKQYRDQQRRKALDEMAREAGEQGYYDQVLLPAS